LRGGTLATAAGPAHDSLPGPTEPNAIFQHVRPFCICLLLATAGAAADTVIDDVVVTGKQSVSLGEKTATAHTLARERLRSTPHLGEDVFRAVARVPGVAADEYAAQFSIRGGEEDEILVLLDGMELYEPFHLKDVNGGALSIVDVEALGSVRLLTGGIPARFGDRLSGVMELTSASPRGERRASLGLSMTNARALAEGQLGDGRGEWLAVARRGYLDLVLGITDASPQVDLRPVYYDGYAKVSRRVGESHTLSAHALWAADTMTIVDDEDTIENSYANGYGWLTWRSDLGDSATQRTLLSVGRVTRERVGIDLAWPQGQLNSQVLEDRAFDLVGIKQDWLAAPSDAHVVSAGFDIKRHAADYTYASSTRRQPSAVGEYATRASARNVPGTQVGVYVSDSVTLSRRASADIGVRYDRASWSGAGLLTPRVAFVHMLGENTAARAGWGMFSQFQRVADLRVEDGEEEFRPPERSEHTTLAVEHVLESGLSLSVEAYWKRLTDIHPRYRNLDGQIDFFPEVARDRATVSPDRGETKGVEIVLTRDVGDALSWWASYAYALAEEEVDSVTTPRDFDQRHAFVLDVSYRPSSRWSLTVAWQVRSGRPYTPLVFERPVTARGFGPVQESYGAVNSARLPPYHRLDVRALRRFGDDGSRLAVYAEVRNLYDRDNVRRYDVDAYAGREGDIVVSRTPVTWLPILPSVGLRWDF
jgi:hypothetical protein